MKHLAWTLHAVEDLEVFWAMKSSRPGSVVAAASAELPWFVPLGKRPALVWELETWLVGVEIRLGWEHMATVLLVMHQEVALWAIATESVQVASA